jgi:hypothetical protein
LCYGRYLILNYLNISVLLTLVLFLKAYYVTIILGVFMVILTMILALMSPAHATTYIHNVTCLNGKKGTAECEGNGVIDKASSQACLNKFCYGGKALHSGPQQSGPQMLLAPNRGHLQAQ